MSTISQIPQITNPQRTKQRTPKRQKKKPSHHNISFKTHLRSQFLIFKQFIDTMIALNKSFKTRFGGSTKLISSLPYFALRDRFLFDFQFNFQAFVQKQLEDFTKTLGKAEEYDKSCKVYVDEFKNDVKNVIQIVEKKCKDMLDLNNKATFGPNKEVGSTNESFKFEIEQLKEFILEDKKGFERVDSSMFYEIRQPSEARHSVSKPLFDCKENVKPESSALACFNKSTHSTVQFNRKPVLLNKKKLNNSVQNSFLPFKPTPEQENKMRRDTSKKGRKKVKKLSRDKIRKIKSQATSVMQRDKSKEIINKIISESVFETTVPHPETIKGSIRFMRETLKEESIDNTEHIKSIYEEKKDVIKKREVKSKRSPDSNTLQYSQISHYRQDSEESSKLFTQKGSPDNHQIGSFIQLKGSNMQNVSQFCEVSSPDFKQKNSEQDNERYTEETFGIAKKYLQCDLDKKNSVNGSEMGKEFRSSIAKFETGEISPEDYFDDEAEDPSPCRTGKSRFTNFKI